MASFLTIISAFLLTVNSPLTCRIFKKIIIGIVIAHDVTLSLIASSVGKSLASSGIRYMERFLSRLRINWSAIGRAVVAQLPPSVKLIVSMDRTAWKTGTKVYNILTVGINFGGISLPVAAINIGRDGASNGPQMIEVTEILLSFLPVGRIELLCADREFCSMMYLRWLKYVRVPFCIRLQGRLLVISKGRQVKLDKYLERLSVGQQIVLKNLQLTYSKPAFKAYIWAYRLRPSTKDDNGLLILATPKRYANAKDAYRLRWYIENTFRCLKSSGFDLEKTHISDPVRLMNLIMLVCIAFDGLCITGAKTLKKHPIRVQSTTRRLRETIFKRGLILIEAILVGNSVSMVADGSNVKFDTDFST